MEKQKKTIGIRVADLKVGYAAKGNVNVVAGPVNACLYQGELTCLLGPNGIGKSTLLRTLSGFQPKLSGQVFFHDREIGTFRRNELAEILSVVLTEKCEIQNLSVEEVAALGRSPYTGFWGRLSQQDRSQVAHALQLVGVEQLAGRMIHTLSDGERQKVMIARALAQDTPVVFLDEPTSFLDFPSKVEMMQLLHRLSRLTRKTIFMSTHDLELALQLADKVWLMDREKGVVTGTPEDLALEGVLETLYTRKGVVFDRRAGVFRVEYECGAEIGLTGDGVVLDMVRKALLRNGWKVLPRQDVEVSVQADKSGIRIFRQGVEAARTDTVEQLLEELMN